ncbi:hypothetical protein [Streptomyces violaceus]|uniref:4Fe-4S Mo/W bis-MGD-type domain-containing protein n=1 Tax=Streptomyces violaceus TaxID=1936 RepID=A0ABZ1NKX5_STRVL
MTIRPLLCTKCGSQCGVAEDVESCIDWGPAVIADDGTVQPEYPKAEDGYQEVWNAVKTLRTRAFCINPECRHGWTLRRRFEPVTP